MRTLFWVLLVVLVVLLENGAMASAHNVLSDATEMRSVKSVNTARDLSAAVPVDPKRQLRHVTEGDASVMDNTKSITKTDKYPISGDEERGLGKLLGKSVVSLSFRILRMMGHTPRSFKEYALKIPDPIKRAKYLRTAAVYEGWYSTGKVKLL
ncbi:unnamed protein product [Phytophthora fragariaefolia]|uniref:Unnamed protein product n=1 Tax=Phytophthora fragariaefolia TaxID=1490495 RepID=A0A9W7CSE4_9STRA|nr:unnamed protein product [Phytophthora fragariaefolia]